MSPFPGTKVIPDGWAAHHRPAAEGTMTTPATFFRPTGPAPYPRPEKWEGITVIWMTTVRVQSLNVAAPSQEAGARTVTVRRYLVTAPVGGPALQVGDQVHVLGRRLRITDLTPGSLLWEVDLTCKENLTGAAPVELVPDGTD